MPPKPAPKLTKKELKQLALQQAKKKQQEEKKRQQQQEERARQNQRLEEIEAKKRAQQEQQRIENQKNQYLPTIEERIKNQKKALQQLQDTLEWEHSTTEYYKNYDVRGTNLSTFINIFREEDYKKPQKSLELCEQAELIISRLQQQILTYRSDGDHEKQKEALAAMKEIHTIEMQKLEEIMIQMANSAQQMEEKNNEIVRNKGEPNRKPQSKKLLEYIQYMSNNFKIGMFLNSTTTKTINKFRPIEIKEFGLNTQIPSKWINANTIVKFEWVNFEPTFEMNKDQNQSQKEKQNNEFLIIGGVFNLQFYELLMGSKRMNTVTLKKLFKGKQILEKFKLQTSLIKQPFQMQYKIPREVFLHTFDHDNLQFAQYDSSIGKWTTLPNDTVQQYDANEKKVVLRVARPEPIAYIQVRCLDYPYVGWQLRTIKDDKVLLDIQLNRSLGKKNSEGADEKLIITFQIFQDLVKLSFKENYSQFADLCSGYKTPEYLLSQLSKRGVHLLPENVDYLEAKVKPKDSETQKNAIRDIAYGLEGFYFRSLPNDNSEIIVKIRQNLDHETIFLQDQEKDWKKIHWRNDRCWISNRNINIKHFNFENLLEKQTFCDKECLERIKYDRKFLLRKTIMKMLSLTRILSFTSGKQQPSKLREVIKQRILVN